MEEQLLALSWAEAVARRPVAEAALLAEGKGPEAEGEPEAEARPALGLALGVCAAESVPL